MTDHYRNLAAMAARYKIEDKISACNCRWMPISTATLDGSLILLISNLWGDGDYFVWAGGFVKGLWTYPAFSTLTQITDQEEWDMENAGLTFEPVFWMPITAPPEFR